MLKIDAAIGPGEDSPPPVRAEYSEDGVDLSLIRWMLSLTPGERLEVLEKAANEILQLRAGLH